MNSKNLPLMFVIVLVAAAISLWSIFYGEGVRLGIDLRGGYKLTYEIYAKEGDPSNLSERVISLLKQRVDKRGLAGIEWRPLGKSRFEVRMPTGREESTAARQQYTEALKTLEAGNIQRSELVRLFNAAPEQRDPQIAKLAGGNDALAQKLRELVVANDAATTARRRLDSAADAGARQRLSDEYNVAQNRVEALTEKVMASNIRMGRIEQVLQNYVSPRESDEGASSKSELDARQKNFTRGVEELKKQYPLRADQIEAVVASYKQWHNVRRFLEDPSDLKRLIAKTGVLEFRIAPFDARHLPPNEGLTADVSEAEVKQLKQQLATEGPDAGRKRGDRWQWFRTHGGEKEFSGLITGNDESGLRYVLLAGNSPNDTLLHGAAGTESDWQLNSARLGYDQMGKPAVNFTFDPRGAQKFAVLTGQHHKKLMAILLDDEVYSAPRIQATISDNGQITGNFTQQDVDDLVRTLDAGSLPARVNPEPVSESMFAPSIGKVNADMGKEAGIWGLVIVAVFILVYYLRGGLIADLALVLNMVFLLGAMSLMRAYLTLPGIAGVILTIGMAIDANVLIFERLREEQEKGQPIRTALKNAYSRAFSAIFDSNITTLLTCLILGWVGTEEVRGFAITLGLGIVISMFTALVVTRWVFQALLDLRLMTKPLRFLHFFGMPRIDWMSKRYAFWGLSGTFIVIGIISLIGEGKDLLGIELAAGTEAQVTFRDDALPQGQLLNDDLVREMFKDAVVKLGKSSATQAAGTGAGEFDRLLNATAIMTIVPNHVSTFLADHNLPQDKPVSLAQWDKSGLNPAMFKKLDANGDDSLTSKELERLPQTTYRISTTETRLKPIREAVEAAFGDSIITRKSLKTQRVRGQAAPTINVPIAAEGFTRITPALANQAAPEYRGRLLDYVDGVLFVVKLDPQSPAITAAELAERIRSTRVNADPALQFNNVDVIGLVAGPKNTFREFAVMVQPADADSVRDKAAWESFAGAESQLLDQALQREEAIVATNFDAQIAGEAKALAIVAMVLAWISIIAYLWLRFGSLRWGTAAVICLVHDVLITLGLVAASNWLWQTPVGKVLGIEPFKIDLTMIAAVLTLVGYSVNDTIVVFDRIRENRGKLTTISPAIINLSINQTLSRTVLTSATTLMVVVVMYIWGGPGIHAFSYAMLVGILFGTYSSIAIASPLVMGFKSLAARPSGVEATQ
ncbi:MAG: protein translocase subunit SecD [Planctomycetaceae bacterium]|nr:protein translocase subunit SecD [Planctomycetaceae bacterium]